MSLASIVSGSNPQPLLIGQSLVFLVSTERLSLNPFIPYASVGFLAD